MILHRCLIVHQAVIFLNKFFSKIFFVSEIEKEGGSLLPNTVKSTKISVAFFADLHLCFLRTIAKCVVKFRFKGRNDEYNYPCCLPCSDWFSILQSCRSLVENYDIL